MKAFKGFTREIMSRMRNGNPEKCTFLPGITIEEEKSKTGREGYHCCEYIFDCMYYYPMDGENRFFQVEAEGDIDEDEDRRISCTRITLVRELGPKEIALEGMIYMIEHPQRSGWKCQALGVQADRDRAEAGKPGHIAIARGMHPAVKGVEGSIAGLVREDQYGNIRNARMVIVSKALEDCWISINEEGKVIRI